MATILIGENLGAYRRLKKDFTALGHFKFDGTYYIQRKLQWKEGAGGEVHEYHYDYWSDYSWVVFGISPNVTLKANTEYYFRISVIFNDGTPEYWTDWETVTTREYKTYEIMPDGGLNNNSIRGANNDYAIAHGLASGSLLTSSQIGQQNWAGNKRIYRLAVRYVLTDILPEGIKSASFNHMVLNSDGITNDLDIVIQSGLPTYPHNPVVGGDYYRGHYSDDGGRQSFVSGKYAWRVDIDLNGDGLSWLATTTRLMLRTSRDINAVEPSGEEQFSLWAMRLLVEINPPTTSILSIDNLRKMDAGDNWQVDCHCRIDSQGGKEVSLKGVAYNLTGDPEDYRTTRWDFCDPGTGEYDYTLQNLIPGNTYYIWAYAYNQEGGYSATYKILEILATEITTQAASVPVPVANPAYCEWATGNGTIVGGEKITERGFEIKHEFSGGLYDRIQHGIAGFEGDITWDIVLEWNGTLIKIETEGIGLGGYFEAGAYDMELGSFPAFLDKLFAGESYTYRAYMVSDGEYYYGEWVAFSLGVYTGDDAAQSDGIVGPTVPITEPVVTEDELLEPWELEWEWPEIIFPEWEDIPFNIPPFEFDEDITFGRIFGAYIRKLDTKKDWKTLREKCIIYQENMNQFTLTVNHNTLVLKNLVNDIITYIDGDVYPSDLKLMNSSQQLTPLYLEEISPDGFKDIINDFRLKDVCNVFELNQNFIKILNSLNSLYESDKRTEPISYNAREYIDIQPTAKRMILQLEDMRKKTSEVQKLVIRNIKRIFTYV